MILDVGSGFLFTVDEDGTVIPIGEVINASFSLSRCRKYFAAVASAASDLSAALTRLNAATREATRETRKERNRRRYLRRYARRRRA